MASPRPANLSEFLLIAPRAIPLKIIASSPKINADTNKERIPHTNPTIAPQCTVCASLVSLVFCGSSFLISRCLTFAILLMCDLLLVGGTTMSGFVVLLSIGKEIFGSVENGVALSFAVVCSWGKKVNHLNVKYT